MNMQSQMMMNNMGNNMMNNNLQSQMMQKQMMQNMIQMQNQMNMNQMAEMMKNMNNNNQNNSQQSSSNNQSSSSQGSGGGINVVFRVSGPGGQGRPPLTIQCMLNEKVSEVIERYRTKSGDKDTSKKFIFNAKNLNQNMTVGEAGITNNGNIFVVTTQGVKGAY